MAPSERLIRPVKLRRADCAERPAPGVPPLERHCGCDRSNGPGAARPAAR